MKQAEIKQLNLDDGDIIVLNVDVANTDVRTTSMLAKQLKKSLGDKFKFVVVFKGGISKMSKESLKQYIETLQSVLDSMGDE